MPTSNTPHLPITSSQERQTSLTPTLQHDLISSPEAAAAYEAGRIQARMKTPPPPEPDYGCAYIVPTMTHQRVHLPRSQPKYGSDSASSWLTGHGNSPTPSGEPLLLVNDESPRRDSPTSPSRSTLERMSSRRQSRAQAAAVPSTINPLLEITMELSTTQIWNEKGGRADPHVEAVDGAECCDEKYEREPGCLRGWFGFRRLSRGFRKRDLGLEREP
jgi:hypothetical protein